jgi:D-threonate/D-erythronate kinase
MPRLLIIADDLSGAADCAAAFVSSGLSALVVLDSFEETSDCEVLSIDCDTRHLEPEAAARRIVEIFLPYAKDRELLLYKKLDSTLRGNVAGELIAILATRRRSLPTEPQAVALLTPAFPARGRTTVDGHQFIHGVPLHESETWKHEQSSSSTHIPSMLESAGLRTIQLDLNLVRSERRILKDAMNSFATSDVIVCDAETDEDLHSIMSASLSLDREIIWAGSAGLAYHLAIALGSRNENSVAPPPLSIHGPILIVIASMSSMAKLQIEVLEAKSTVKIMPMDPSVLMAGCNSPEWSQYAMNLEAMLRAGDDVVVTPKADSQPGSIRRRSISSALGVMMTPFAEITGALIASGGETARVVLDAWSVKGLQMIEEIEPGLPLSITVGCNKPLPVVTKAGAFGDSHTLLRAWQSLRKFRQTIELNEISSEEVN